MWLLVHSNKLSYVFPQTNPSRFRALARVACGDEIGYEIIQLLYEAGFLGVLPKDLQEKLQ
jgi:hypothetical protein